MDPKPSQHDLDRQLRQLALVDRVIGLEAEVAQLLIVRDEVERLRQELDEVYASRTWKIGSAVLRVAMPRRARVR
jgi:hypothetical protein